MILPSIAGSQARVSNLLERLQTPFHHLTKRLPSRLRAFCRRRALSGELPVRRKLLRVRRANAIGEPLEASPGRRRQGRTIIQGQPRHPKKRADFLDGLTPALQPIVWGASGQWLISSHLEILLNAAEHLLELRHVGAARWSTARGQRRGHPPHHVADPAVDSLRDAHRPDVGEDQIDDQNSK